MSLWEEKSVDKENINKGNQYEDGDAITTESFNAIVENSLFAKKVVEAFSEAWKNSKATATSSETPSVEIKIDSKSNALTFNFTLPKGEKGDTGEKGDGTVVYVNGVKQASIDTNNMTVGYAKKLGTSTIGLSNRPIYLSNGVPKAMSGALAKTYGGTGNTKGEGAIHPERLYNASTQNWSESASRNFTLTKQPAIIYVRVLAKDNGNLYYGYASGTIVVPTSIGVGTTRIPIIISSSSGESYTIGYFDMSYTWNGSLLTISHKVGSGNVAYLDNVNVIYQEP